MYLRFTTPGVVTRARVAPGLFGPAFALWYGAENHDDPVLIALRRELDWFNHHLPVPSRFGVVARGRRWSDGVCWFRDDARDMLSHAHALAALLWDSGIAVDQVWTRHPGQLLYRDPWQVVAKPDRKHLH